jgi:hypothetical protein
MGVAHSRVKKKPVHSDCLVIAIRKGGPYDAHDFLDLG